jgi:hypothetical protein
VGTDRGEIDLYFDQSGSLERNDYRKE